MIRVMHYGYKNIAFNDADAPDAAAAVASVAKMEPGKNASNINGKSQFRVPVFHLPLRRGDSK